MDGLVDALMDRLAVSGVVVGGVVIGGLVVEAFVGGLVCKFVGG